MSMTSDDPSDTELLPTDLDEAGDIALSPNDAADPPDLVARKLPSDILEKYEVYSYRHAAVILAEAHPKELEDIVSALRSFVIDTNMIRRAGGNESEIPKIFSKSLRPIQWHETTISADLDVKLSWRQPEIIGVQSKKVKMVSKSLSIKRERYVDGHKIDYVKNKVAFDLEWNSKDQTFDRDLYAMNAFFLSGAIDVGVLVTRSVSLNKVFRSVGSALKKDGSIELDDRGRLRSTAQKYGASTTWMGKLLYRLNAGRNGGCPILAVGITPAAVLDWKDES